MLCALGLTDWCQFVSVSQSALADTQVLCQLHWDFLVCGGGDGSETLMTASRDSGHPALQAVPALCPLGPGLGQRAREVQMLPLSLPSPKKVLIMGVSLLGGAWAQGPCRVGK